MERHFHQHASGEFAVDVVPGTAHCGLDDRHGHFRYGVDLTYKEGALDEKAFLLDNTTFQRYFQSLGPVNVSCETLTLRAVEQFKAELGDRVKFLTSIEVKLYPFGDVYVSTEEKL